MQDDPDKAARDLARDICAWSRVTDLKADAAELSSLCREEPLPRLPCSLLRLYRLLVEERERSRQLRALLSR